MNHPDDTREKTQIAQTLRNIVDLHQKLITAAINHANAREYPGGEAMNLLAPAANPEAWTHRYDTAETHGLGDYINDQTNAETHPLFVLAWWEDKIRVWKNQPTDLRATVERAADYIRNNLDYLYQLDDYGRRVFLDTNALLADLRTTERHLEDVHAEGERRQWVRVNCTHQDCEDKPRLYAVYGKTAKQDHWKCPACRTEYFGLDMNAALQSHLARTTNSWVTIPVAANITGRPIKTIRTWTTGDKPKVRTRRNENGRTEVFWPDVRTTHLNSGRRTRGITA